MKRQALGIGLVCLIAIVIGGPFFSIMSWVFRKPNVTSTYVTPLRISLWLPAWHSVELGVCSAVLALLVAAPLALTMTFTRLGRIPMVEAICLVPLMTPPYLSTIGWILMMEPNGYVNRWFPWMSPVNHAFVSFGGLVFLMSFHWFPIPYLALVQALKNVSTEGVDAARVHGVKRWTRVRAIWWPSMAPTIYGTLLLVFVNSIGEFGTPLVFGSMVHFPVLTTDIYSAITHWPVNFHLAAELSLCALGISLMAMLAVAFFKSQGLPATNAISFRRSGIFTESSGWAARDVVGVVVFALMMLITLGIPYFSLVGTSLMRTIGNGLMWSNLTWQNYSSLFTASSTSSNALVALVHTFELSAIAACITAALGILMAVVFRFMPSIWTRVARVLAMLPNTVPHLLFVVGLILFWDSSWLKPTLYDTRWMIVLAFVALFLPYALLFIGDKLDAMPATLWESGLGHGLSRARVARIIVAPLLVSAVGSAWINAFSLSVRDITVPLMLSPPSFATASAYIYQDFVQTSLSGSMALAVITIFVGVVCFVAIQSFSLRSDARRETSRTTSIQRRTDWVDTID